MKQCLLFLILAIFMIAPSSAVADGEEDASIRDGVSVWMEEIDWQSFDRLLDRFPEETQAFWNHVSLRELTEEIALTGGENAFSVWKDGRATSVIKQLFSGVYADLAGTIAVLIGLSMLSALCLALTEDGKDGTQAVASFICRCFTLTVVLGVFSSMAKLANECMESLCACMELAMPVLTTLLTAMGGNASVGVLQPAMAFLTGGVAMSMKTMIIPLLLCAGTLSMFDSLSERFHLSEMSAMLKSTVKWGIGIVTTLFSAIIVLRGMTAAAFDGVGIRAAKYAAGSMFPMVGGLIGGSFDTVIGCAGLVKNAAGLAAILLCVTAAAIPIARLAFTAILFRITAAVLQPIAGKNQVSMCRAGADMLSGLLSACAAITAMFVVALGLTVAIGNAALIG